MLRNIIAVIAGFAIWTVIFLGGSAIVRAIMPEVFDDAGFTSDETALAIILGISVIASFICGFAASKIATSHQMLCGWVLAGCLLATGIPVQLSAWDKLPIWYNLIFLILLVPITMAGNFLYVSLQVDVDARR